MPFAPIVKGMQQRLSLLICLVAIAVGAVDSSAQKSPRHKSRRDLANTVKKEFLHAWNSYERYAWGHDALKPLSHTPFDWYGESLYMTPVDALGTLVLMGLKSEADKDRALIDKNLSFDKDIFVKNFEITI